jgi:hypothetical protein
MASRHLTAVAVVVLAIGMPREGRAQTDTRREAT